MEKTQQRIEYLDYGKAIAITAILIAHVVHLSESKNLGILFEALGWLGCPLFFMISGAVRITNPNWSWKKYFLRIAKICIVFIVWKYIYYLAGRVVYSHIEVGKTDLIKYLFTVSHATDNFFAGNLWFIYAMLFLEIFTPIFNMAYNSGKQGRQALLFTGIIAWLFSGFIFSGNLFLAYCYIPVSFNSFTEINPFGYYGNFIIYYILGAFLLDNRENINTWFEKRKGGMHILRITCLALVFISTLALIYSRYRYSKSITLTNMPLMGGYYYTSVLVQSVAIFIYIGTVKIGKIRGFIGNLIGKRTLGLYYLQSLILTGAPVIACTWVYYPYGKVLLIAFVMAVSLAVCLVLERIPVVKHLVR